jgi:hypothetical protein
VAQGAKASRNIVDTLLKEQKASIAINITNPKNPMQVQMFLPHTQGPEVCTSTTTVGKLAKVYSHCNHSAHATKTSRNIVIFPSKYPTQVNY